MDRRNFIKQGSVAAAVLVTSNSVLASLSNNLNSNKTINIGIVGTGDRGSGLIPLINGIENLNVYACCDVIPSRLEEGISRTNGKAKGYSNYKDLLNDKEINAVIIATTFSEHSKVAIDAVTAGKHVYCEKTMAKGYEGIHNLVAKVMQSNVIFQTGHQYHSSRLYTHVVELLKKGKVGNISAFECQWNRHGNWRRPVSDPSLEKAINWRMYRETSGGLVAELCSHQIDFVNTVLESNPIQVMGTGGIDYYKDGRETFDNIHLIYNYPNGIKAKFSSILNNAKDGYQIKVIGDKGTLIITTNSAKFYPEGKKKTLAQKPQEVDGVSSATWQADDKGYGEIINISHENPSKQALTDFRNSILDKKEPVSNIITGAKAAICVQMGLDAIYNNEIIYGDTKFKI